MAFPSTQVEAGSGAPAYAQSLFQEWIRIVEEYCEKVTTDAPFWHGERAQVGLLAAAAWRSGLVALEEFTQSKEFETEREQGRADLWIKGEGAEDFLEARFIDWNPADTKPKHLKEKIDEVHEEVKRIKVDLGTLRRAGLVFWSPRVDESPEDDEKSAIEACISLCREVKPDALAWCFPLDRRKNRPDGTDTGPVWPGTLVLARWWKAT